MGKDVVERTEQNLSALSQLLGEDNVEDIKKCIGNLIVERIHDDLRSYDCYLFYPPDYQRSIDEAFEKVEKKLVKMYTNAMLESAQEAVQRFKDISIASINDTQGLQLRSCHKCNHCDGSRCKFYDMYYWEAHDGLCAEEGFINYIEKEGK